MTQIVKKIGLLLFGSSEYGFAVFGQQLKTILADENLANELLVAIDMNKHGKGSKSIQIKNKSYKLVRLSESQIAI